MSACPCPHNFLTYYIATLCSSLISLHDHYKVPDFVHANMFIFAPSSFLLSPPPGESAGVPGLGEWGRHPSHRLLARLERTGARPGAAAQVRRRCSHGKPNAVPFMLLFRSHTCICTFYAVVCPKANSNPFVCCHRLLYFLWCMILGQTTRRGGGTEPGDLGRRCSGMCVYISASTPRQRAECLLR